MALGTTIVLGIPTLTGNRRSPAWIDAMAAIGPGLGASFARYWTVDLPIAEARNGICETALAIGAPYLMMLGDDVLPPQGVLPAMLNKIGRTYLDEDGTPVRASMITGVYWTKGFPPEPYLWQTPVSGPYRDWKAGEFFPITLAGCDCLLIETEMLKTIPRPWFSTEWVWNEDQRAPSPIATEDFYFYLKARQYGYRLFCDSQLQCWHQDRDTGVMYGLTPDSTYAGGVPETPDDDTLLVADLGAGHWTVTFGKNTRIVRFDMRPDTKPDVRCDIRDVPAEHFGRYDIVHASHVIEHFRREEAPGLLRHWTKLLKPGGKLILRVPNVAHAMERILAAEREPGMGHNDMYDWAQLYGDQARPGPASEHLNGFTARKLEALMRTHPDLTDIEVVGTHEGGERDLNLKATATLVRQASHEIIGDWYERTQVKPPAPEPVEKPIRLPRGGNGTEPQPEPVGAVSEY